MKSPESYLEKLLDAYFDGTLDVGMQADLDELLTADAGARQRFWDRAAMESALEDWAAKARGEAMVFPPAPRKPAPRRLPRFLTISGWAAAAALMLAWSFHSREHPAAPGTPAPAAATAQTAPARRPGFAGSPVAYLSRLSGVPGADGLLAGQCLLAGRELTIREGVLEIDFYSGARVALRGPARFLPGSDMLLTVSEGAVQVEVPESAKGFVLMLPDGKVTDFGTNFEVIVKDAQTSRLQVTKGEIELVPRTGGSARRMFQGDALSLTDPSGPQPIAFQPMAQPSLNEARNRDRQARMAAWETACAALDADPAVLVHFRFLQAERGTREIINRATAAHVPRHGTVIAAEWARGRWEGKPALSFRGPSDRVRVDLPGDYPQVTYAAWVKVDGFPRRYNGLFLSEANQPGEAHWQFSTEGQFMFGVRPAGDLGQGRFHRQWSDSVLSAEDYGTWRLVATTYDSINRVAAHYVDGQQVYRADLDYSIPLHFGRATLGNFYDPQPEEHAGKPGLGETWSFRNWCGAIDEFLLIARALEPGEIAALHEAGRAY